MQIWSIKQTVCAKTLLANVYFDSFYSSYTDLAGIWFITSYSLLLISMTFIAQYMLSQVSHYVILLCHLTSTT